VSRSIDDLIRKMHALEEELQVEYRKKREEFDFIIQKKRVRFAVEIALQQRRFKSGIFGYLRHARLLNILTAPIIYAGLVPVILLDLFLWAYQGICFPIYGIAKVKRSDYLVFDRTDLPYLNIIEKCNCFYCSYVNGLAAFLREIAARTEQYWCPIKHARRIRDAHSHYPRFFEFGDAESYGKGLARLRDELNEHKKNIAGSDKKPFDNE
jgi:hypothetical protein